MEIYSELNRFNNILYRDSDHTYTINGKVAISGTKFISRFYEPFDTLGMATKYAIKRQLLVEDVIKLWDDKRDASTIKGTHVHSYAENKYMSKIYQPSFDNVIKRFPENNDNIIEAYRKCVVHFDNFYNDSKKSLVPIKSEFVVGDEDLLICGMLDQLFFNIKANEYQIWDWKTNKEIAKYSIYKKRMLRAVSHLHECEWNKYSLQLALYKYILEKNTNIKIGKCYLVHLTEHKDNYEVIETKNMKREISEMISSYKQAD